MKPRPLILLAVLVVGITTAAQEPKPARPRITGIAKVRILTSSPVDAQRLYFRDLGLAALQNGCDDGSFYCLGINGHQRLGLVISYYEEDGSRVSEITLETSNIEQLSNYLDSAGLAVSQLQGVKGGDRHFSVRDPDGHRIGFMEHATTESLPHSTNQISARIIHAGFVVHDRAAEDRFYKDILGFHVYWHGGMKDDETNWVDMQVPDGTDWIEYMLNVPADADKHTLGVMNHIALGVPDIHAAQQQLIKNGWKGTEQPKIGRDGKWQLNLYDPDDTRVELMEFTPVEKPCCSEYTGPHPKP